MATEQQKKIRQKWVAALRSGQYKQGTCNLVTRGKKEDQFCCLGVLCDMAVRAGIIPKPELPGVGNTYEYEGMTGLPSKKVREWAGLINGAGTSLEYHSLASLNDEGKTFKHIAKIIESEPEGLFS